MIVYTIQENNDVIAVCDSVLKCFEWLNTYYGYDISEYKQNYKDIRDSGLECTFNLNEDYYLIKYFLLND